MLFSVGSVVYALPIEPVRAVVNPQEIIPLPHAPSSVIGVTDHRGDVVPVIDLRTRFGLPQQDGVDLRRTKWIMVDVGDASAPRPVAAVVDTVLNVHMTRDPLRPPPPLGGGEDRRGILGVLGRAGATGDAGLIFVLDLARLRALIEPVHPANTGPANAGPAKTGPANAGGAS